MSSRERVDQGVRRLGAEAKPLMAGSQEGCRPAAGRSQTARRNPGPGCINVLVKGAKG